MMDELKVKDKVIIKRYIKTVEGVIKHVCQYDLRTDRFLVEIKDGKQEWYSAVELEKI